MIILILLLLLIPSLSNAQIVGQGQGGSSAWLVSGSGTFTVGAVNLDIRDLVFATDKVDVSGSSVTGSGNFTVVQPTGTNLHIVCDSGCGGPTAFEDNDAFTFGTTSIGNIGFVVDDTATNSVSENSAGAPRMSTSRIAYSNLRSGTGTEINSSTVAASATGLGISVRPTGILATGTIDAADESVSASITSVDSIVVSIFGTWDTGELQFEASVDGSAWRDVSGFKINSTTGGLGSTTGFWQESTDSGDNGIWYFPYIGAYQQFRVLQADSTDPGGDANIIISGGQSENHASIITDSPYGGGASVIQGTPISTTYGLVTRPSTSKLEDDGHTTADTGAFVLGVRNDGGSTQVTSANADYSQISVDAYGAAYSRPDHPNRVACNISSTATTSAIITGCSAPGAGLSIYITSLQWASSIISTTTNFMTIQSGTGGTCGASIDVLYRGYQAPAFAGKEIVFQTPIKAPANEEICLLHPGAGTRLVSVQGFIAP